STDTERTRACGESSRPQAICSGRGLARPTPRWPTVSSKDNFEFAHQHRREVAWMSQNTNTLPVHPAILEAIRRSVDEREFNLYRKPYVLTPEWANASITRATKMLLLIDPNNPLGSGYTRDQVRGLSDVARDRDLWLLNDVTYRDFNKGHVLASAFYPEQTLTSYSFSKGPGLAGMRIGALVAPPGGTVMKALRRLDTNVLGVNVLAQRAALAALQTKKEWLPEVRKTC